MVTNIKDQRDRSSMRGERGEYDSDMKGNIREKNGNTKGNNMNRS